MPLRTPPLRGLHADRGASFTEFGGWDMPVEFDSIKTEHAAVREAAGLFDVSHMGESTVSGPDAAALMGRLVTADVAALDPGEAVYGAITDADGVILDDTVVYRLPEDGAATPATGADGTHPTYLFVPNAGHDEEMHGRWTTHRDEWGLDATVENLTDDLAMFALQGPDAVEHLAGATPTAVEDLGRFTATVAPVAGVDCLVARTGYTGEDGFELVIPWADAETVWRAFAGGNDASGDGDGTDATVATPGVQPCGLGARDTLRIEAGFLLSGQDFDPADEPRTPFEAGIGFAVDLDHEFVGRDALAGAGETDERFVGFSLVERGVPRHGYDITSTEGRVIGTVTSGTMSPTLGEPIGMGYVPAEYADPGTTIRVVVRGQQKKARVRTLPFLPD